MKDQPDYAAAIASAARTMSQSRSQQEALQTIVEVARDSIPGFDSIGITTVDKGGNANTRAKVGDLVDALDRLQYGLGEGPCVETLHGAEVVSAPMIRDDQRWPRYVPQAVAQGLRSQLAVRLFLDDKGTIGGLNLYSSMSDDIDPEAVSTAGLFAAHAAIAFGFVSEIEGLNQALQSRKVIGQALGILMERYEIGEDAAFAFLVRASSHGNIKLRDIAQELVDGRNPT
jgi:GAF domain-containing protein